MAHNKLFQAGGVNFKKFIRKMKYKYIKTIYEVAFKKQMNSIPAIQYHKNITSA